MSNVIHADALYSVLTSKQSSVRSMKIFSKTAMAMSVFDTSDSSKLKLQSLLDNFVSLQQLMLKKHIPKVLLVLLRLRELLGHCVLVLR